MKELKGALKKYIDYNIIKFLDSECTIKYQITTWFEYIFLNYLNLGKILNHIVLA
ncbi:hypothetical protein NARC_10129 [Candidatus Nitrosocosmicus arcticus]|uniref:Uncharacterized protein n=1 Tax=Candidatus Nitrosocosmicus arcticus TaxID=2035267 RepID=A0A557SYQ9_9ARCH|nr:hypothetical protein NARC_10129 [Candidatus Nitrosocosmicus arcticus]